MSLVAVEALSEFGRWEGLKKARSHAILAARVAISISGVPVMSDAKVTVLLTSDARIAELNGRWRGKPVPTNVLSFPAVTPRKLATSPVLGDIAIAYETCAREAGEEDKTMLAHFLHLVVHGALHLVGYDHQTKKEAEAMESMERRILKGLGVADPYAGTEVP